MVSIHGQTAYPASFLSTIVRIIGEQLILEHPVVREIVTLKAMCSKKWAVPLFLAVSARLPASIKTPTVAVWAEGLDSVAIVKPFLRDVMRVPETLMAAAVARGRTACIS